MGLAEHMKAHGWTDGRLGTEVGVSHDTVRIWRTGKRLIPAKHVGVVSAVTGIPRHVLRPDLWEPPPPAKARAKRPAAAPAPPAKAA
jgi:DNA-binding transcriptional regulator YdaS (Cro superfamily)